MSTATAYDPFSTTASNNEGGDFERPDPGTYPARLVSVIDLGTHTRVFNGQAKTSKKLFLTWELCGEMDSKGEAFVVSQDYTRSLVPKANYRKLVEGWTGKALADGQNFNVVEMIDKPCCVTISEGMTSAGKKFTEIASVGPPMKGLTIPPLTRDPFVFTVITLTSTGDDLGIPGWIPRIYGRTITDEIKASAEYGALPGF